MATLRPQVKDDDGYIAKIIKYIPAEIVAGYTALVGYISVDSSSKIIPDHYKAYYLTILITLSIISPVWTYYSVFDDENPSVIPAKRKALFHAVVSFFAFLIWIYAIGNILLKAVLCKCDTATCENCAIYSPILGSIFLVLFTIATPLFERIILGRKSPKT